MIQRAVMASLFALCCLPALAKAPDSSQRPLARPVSTAPALAKAVQEAAPQRPELRPASEQSQAAARLQRVAFLSPAISARPWVRPKAVEQKAMAKRRMRREGAVCGDVDIQGDVVGDVPGRIQACGIEDAVRVRAVSGVALNPPALMNCKTAKALKTWTDNGLKPAFRQRGPVVEMRVAAHYVCRTRNNQRGARISEHGKGNAIDLSAFRMKDGEVITVLNGWGQGTTLRPLRRAYNRACGPFGTTLGPESDRFHRDHFHFDTANHRGGPYCR